MTGIEKAGGSPMLHRSVSCCLGNLFLYCLLEGIEMTVKILGAFIVCY